MSWVFWLLAALATTLAVGLMLHPLLGRPGRSRRSAADQAQGALPDRADYDLVVYRDQLAEIERDRDRGVLTPSETDAARLEIQRRLLAADRHRQARKESRVTKQNRRLPAAVIVLFVPLASIVLYITLGSPGMPSLPLAERSSEFQRVSEMQDLTGRLRQRLEQDPDDPRGWELLARGLAELGEWPEAAQAYEEAIERNETDRPDLLSAQGEALTAAAGGTVTPAAEAAFNAALDQESGNPRALYYRALARQQAGRLREALDIWMGLAERTPRDAGWRPLLRQRIAETASELGLPAGSVEIPDAPSPQPTPQLSQDQLEAADDMDPQEREEFIRTMVERLAQRLEQQPDDIDGWLRLVQARLVLGEDEAALEALHQAAPLVEDLPEDDRRRRAVEEGLKLLNEGS